MDFMEMTLAQVGILAGAFFTFIILVSFLLTRLYRRSSKELAYVRTGFGGEKVILDGGALVIPILQEIVPVNMLTLRLEVERKNAEGLITADRMRVDVTAEFYVRVKPDREAIAKAAQTLGNRTMQPETLKELLQGKFVDSLRSVAAGLTMEQLHERRAEFIQSVQSSVSEDLLKNGLELESVSLTGLDQTAREYFKEDNAFDAQGLAKLTMITEAKREERNRIEQETRIKIETQNLNAAKQSFEIKKNEEFASLNQKREVEIAKAEQEALIAKEQAERKRQAEEARITAELKVKEANIASQQAVQERDVASRRAVEEAEIARQQSIDTANQEAKIVVARKSEEQSKAEANAAVARAEMVKEEEQVVTVRETAVARREKEIQIIKAEEGAQIEAVKVTVAAQAEKDAASDRAEALRVEAQAQADKIRIVAEAEQKRLEVEAYGEKAINEAKNILGTEIINFELRKLIAQIAPALVEASVKPMEKIDSIRILQANGFGGNGGGAEGILNGAGGKALPNQLVDAALAYRMQLPLVEKMLGELGLDAKTTEGLLSALSQPSQARSHAEGNGHEAAALKN
jgi:uncharacterized membrane protein YqiK